MEMAVVAQARNLTIEEVIHCIESLTDHDWLRIVSSGRALAMGLSGWDSEDLFHEAMTRLMEDDRHVPYQINFTYGILKIMQSLANERREQQTKYWLDVDEDQLETPVDHDALDELVQEESLAALQARVGDDNTASDVLNLRAQGYKPDEICTMLSIKRKTYDSANKRIRRAVLKDMKEQADE